jgi:hypothetical protein
MLRKTLQLDLTTLLAAQVIWQRGSCVYAHFHSGNHPAMWRVMATLCRTEHHQRDCERVLSIHGYVSVHVGWLLYAMRCLNCLSAAESDTNEV